MTVAGSEDVKFEEWLQRIREGDLEAASSLVDRFESVIRREARFAMRDPRLKSLFDSRDVSQSVFKSFFARAQSGQFAFEARAQLSGLLRCMARRKVAALCRHLRREKRDISRLVSTDYNLTGVIDGCPGPTELIEEREFAQRAMAALSIEELQLLDDRQAGKTWSEIAAARGGNAHSQRVRLMRALRRSAQRLQESAT